MTCVCSLKPGAPLTMPSDFTTRFTPSKEPIARLTMDSSDTPVDRAAAFASSKETSSGTLPITRGRAELPET